MRVILLQAVFAAGWVPICLKVPRPRRIRLFYRREASKPALVLLAVGERHPPQPWKLSVYEIAHRRINVGSPGSPARVRTSFPPNRGARFGYRRNLSFVGRAEYASECEALREDPTLVSGDSGLQSNG